MEFPLRHYELVVVLSPMLNQEQAAEAWGRVKNFISNRNGDITHEERWGTRRLAYPIRKGSHQFLEGSYHLTRFSTESPFNRELETFLRVDEEVLRSLVVATEPPGPAPQPEAAPSKEGPAAVAVAEAGEATGEEAVVAAAGAVAEAGDAAGEEAVIAAAGAVAELEEEVAGEPDEE
jgi:small subunit ribosomal protein S6